ncbi:MAG: gamma-glutamyl kinase [Pseudomonadota bacterium]
MMIFFKARLAFLAVPKTGSTAYQSALRHHADMIISNPPALKHAPVYRYNRFIRPMFEKVCGTELEVMALMREPVSWLGSWWRYRQRPAMEGRPTATVGVNFDDFIDAYMQNDRPAFADVGAQSVFLEQRPNGTAVRHLFAYEDDAAIHGFLQERLGITFSLERENASPELTVSLSADVEARLRRHSATDFALYTSIRHSQV